MITPALVLLSIGLFCWPAATDIRTARVRMQAGLRSRAPARQVGSGPLAKRVAAALSGIGGLGSGVARWSATFVGLAVGVPIAVVISVPLGLSTSLLTTVLSLAVLRAARSRRDDADTRADLAALGALADELDAGQTPAAAMRASVEVAGGALAVAFAAASRAVEIGAHPVDVLDRPTSRPSPVAVRVARMWRLSWDEGCPLAAAMRTAERELRDDLRHREHLRALLAGPRSSAALLAGLPVFGLLMGGAVGAHPWHVLTATPIGGALLLAGTGLTVAGLLWTRAVVTRAEVAA